MPPASRKNGKLLFLRERPHLLHESIEILAIFVAVAYEDVRSEPIAHISIRSFSAIFFKYQLRLVHRRVTCQSDRVGPYSSALPSCATAQDFFGGPETLPGLGKSEAIFLGRPEGASLRDKILRNLGKSFFNDPKPQVSAERILSFTAKGFSS
jgi:hypothetical protein